MLSPFFVDYATQIKDFGRYDWNLAQKNASMADSCITMGMRFAVNLVAIVLACFIGVPVNAGEPITPLPETVNLDQAKVGLGRKLFFDPRLSRDNTVSCATCHDLAAGGADGRRFSIGIDGLVGGVNAPTVLNSRYNFRQFWDGRAASLEEQAAGPVHNPVEMGSTWSQVLEKLGSDSDVVAAFEEIYTDGMTAEAITDSIAEFERSLVTPASFDRYLRGDESAISDLAKRGFHLFKRYGCVSCHQGRNLGGNMYQRFGVFGDYFADRGTGSPADLGRFNVTGRESDKNVFKVPMLRNVALTPPYFHDGSVARLDNAVRVMARYQLGVEIPPDDRDAIVAFLHSLTGTELGAVQ